MYCILILNAYIYLQFIYPLGYRCNTSEKRTTRWNRIGKVNQYRSGSYRLVDNKSIEKLHKNLNFFLLLNAKPMVKEKYELSKINLYIEMLLVRMKNIEIS